MGGVKFRKRRGVEFKILLGAANRRDWVVKGIFLQGRMTMLGNPRWFRAKAVGFGLVPTSWRGWAYSAAWGGTIGLPFLLMLGRHQSVEALLWLVLSIGAMGYDVWQILRAIRGPRAQAQVCSVRVAERQRSC